MVSKVEFRITEITIKRSIREYSDTHSPLDGSPGWYQNKFSEQTHKDLCKTHQPLNSNLKCTETTTPAGFAAQQATTETQGNPVPTTNEDIEKSDA